MIGRLFCFGTFFVICSLSTTIEAPSSYYQNPEDLPPGGFLTRIQDFLSTSSSSAKNHNQEISSDVSNVNAI